LSIIQDFDNYIYGAISAVATGGVLLIRKVLTNEAKLRLLQQEISQREEFRKERDKKLEDQLSEIKENVNTLIKFNLEKSNG
jgi:hypothetical protein